MLTKKYINDLKVNNPLELSRILQVSQDPNNLKFVLSNLGSLPNNFNEKSLLPLIKHSDSDIRLLTVKNLGKLSKKKYLDLFTEVAKNDSNSMVRREAVSAIGRLRNSDSIPILLEFLKDNDPKVVLQSIRGLLVFKKKTLIVKELKKLINHPNEIIQDLIAQEFYKSSDKTSTDNHCQSPDYLKNTVVLGDVRKIIKLIDDQSIHLTFTSPPYYNARDYSIYNSYQDYLDFLTEVFQEVHRITKEGRFLVVNTSPIIIPRVSRSHASKRYPIPFDLNTRLLEIGWEFIDDIIWLKPESSVKNRNGGFRQHRKPLAYKPNVITEYVMVYRKKSNKLLDWNLNQYESEIVEKSKVSGGYESSNVWKIDPTFDQVHSAVFPIELANRIIKFYSYQEDLIFDPFGGSGTVGRSASFLNRYFFMTEKETKYVERMKEDLAYKTLFTKQETKFITSEQFINIIKKLPNKK